MGYFSWQKWPGRGYARRTRDTTDFFRLWRRSSARRATGVFTGDWAHSWFAKSPTWLLWWRRTKLYPSYSNTTASWTFQKESYWWTAKRPSHNVMDLINSIPVTRSAGPLVLVVPLFSIVGPRKLMTNSWWPLYLFWRENQCKDVIDVATLCCYHMLISRAPSSISAVLFYIALYIATSLVRYETCSIPRCLLSSLAAC